MTDQYLWVQIKISYSRNWKKTLLKPDCHSWWISKMQSETLEERYAIKFCFKLGKNATETYGMLHTAFGASCMNRASVFEWHKRFKEVSESMRDDERCGRSKEVNTPELIGQRVRIRVTMFQVLREFSYSLSSEAAQRQLMRWKRLWRKSLIRLHKRTSMMSSRSCWNGTSALQPGAITSKETRVSCVYCQ